MHQSRRPSSTQEIEAAMKWCRQETVSAGTIPEESTKGNPIRAVCAYSTSNVCMCRSTEQRRFNYGRVRPCVTCVHAKRHLSIAPRRDGSSTEWGRISPTRPSVAPLLVGVRDATAVLETSGGFSSLLRYDVAYCPPRMAIAADASSQLVPPSPLTRNYIRTRTSSTLCSPARPCTHVASFSSLLNSILFQRAMEGFSDSEYFQKCRYIHEVELVNMKLQMRILETHLEVR